MNYEVEVKFPLENAAKLIARLEELAVSWTESVQETDIYFQHPCRNFAATDEALRIRRTDSRAYLTYKGPKIDSSTKTRTELEVELDVRPEILKKWQAILEQLGFRPVAEVRKNRQRGILVWGGWTVQVSVDRVEGLGSFLELEVVVPQEKLDIARESVLTLCQALGLGLSERRSYLELLLETLGKTFPLPEA